MKKNNRKYRIRKEALKRKAFVKNGVFPYLPNISHRVALKLVGRYFE